MDKPTLLRGLAVTAELLGTPLSPDALEIMANDLMELGTGAGILQALIRVRREHKGRLTLAAMIERLPNQPLGAEAAWELAMRLHIWDENATIVAPKAVLACFPHSIWAAGDKVGARMAFKERYASAGGAPGAAWEVSEGLNPAGREPAILEALRLGHLTEDVARHLLPNTPEDRFAIAQGRPVKAIGDMRE